MFLKKFGLIGLIGGVGLATSACTDGYGYSGVSLGYGNGGYYDDGYGYYGGDYYDGYGGPYGYGGGYGYGGYGYSPAYYGWNGGYYYPGSGYYVYDRYRRPHRWSDRQRHYWENRNGHGGRPNWDHFGGGYANGGRDVRNSLGTALRNNSAYDRGGYNRGGYNRSVAPRMQAPQRSFSRPASPRGGGVRGSLGRALRR